MIIVIDGPAGSGKSTTARAVADTLGIEYLDSGALYRALTLIYLEAGRDVATFFDTLVNTEITFSYKSKRFHVYKDGAEITEQLRSMEVSDTVSEVAAMPHARKFVNGLMHKAVGAGTYIAEGRDLGTAVFPDAALKFYMSADVEERARRRYDELKSAGQAVSLEEVKQNILQRDKKDSARSADPLKKAEDAVEIDTTNLSFEQQVQQICSVITKTMESKL